MRSISLRLFCLALLASPVLAQVSVQKISSTSGGLSGPLDGLDRFGWSCAAIGDLDGDGTRDVAVGVPSDDDGGANRGAVYILFLDTDGTIQSEQKISDTSGGFFGVLDNGDQFGSSVTLAGDLDGDGSPELAVGAIGDDDGGNSRGAVWLLSLNTNGMVKASRKISQTMGGFFGSLQNADLFGSSLAALGDFSGDGIPDIAVGATGDDGAGSDRGAVYLIALSATGSVLALVKISDTSGGFTGTLADDDGFGAAIVSVGDLDGDSNDDLAVGANFDDDGGVDRGAVWILFLNGVGQVSSHAKVSSSTGVGGLADADAFGTALAFTGDRNQDGLGELLVGAPQADGSGSDRGAVHVIDLDSAGAVESSVSLSGDSGLGAILADSDFFGRSVCDIGDLDSDGYGDLFAGAVGDDDGAGDAGAGYVVFLECVGQASTAMRNGTGVNPATFVSVTPPIIGVPWNATIDVVTPGASASFVQVALGGPTAPIPLSGVFKGELLVLPPYTTLDIALGVHAINVPANCSIVGGTFSLQGGTFKPGCLQLCNALDLTFGTY